MADEIERNSPPPAPGDAIHVGRELLTPEASAPVLAHILAERLWFAGMLRVVAKAMRAVEWVDSSEVGELPDYESATARLCYACACESVAAFGSAQ